MNDQPTNDKTRVVIAGGGVAGIEALLALHDLAGDQVSLTLVAPQPDFLYKPLLVEEPFDLGPADRHELAPLASEMGANFTQRAVSAVRPEDHVVELDDGSTLDYDYLIVCAGGRFRSALEGATTFPSGAEPFSADEVLDRAEGKDHRMAFVVPNGVTWSLPLYEIALMTQRRAKERALDVKIAIVTPSPHPLRYSEPHASAAIGSLLEARRIEFLPLSTVREISESGITLSPKDRVLGPAEVIALPVMEGPGIDGLPADEGASCPSTISPESKESRTSTQRAMAPTSRSSKADWALSRPMPPPRTSPIGSALPRHPSLRPVLRGKLITGDESLSLKKPTSPVGAARARHPRTAFGGRRTRSAPVTWRRSSTTTMFRASRIRQLVPSTSK